MASPVDILIIGGGISGISAAASIVRQNHTVAILDSQKYRNGGSPHMHTLATWDHRSPADWRAAAMKDFGRYGTVPVENEEVVKVEKLEKELSFFKITTESGRSWICRKVILATGVEDILPNIPGYADAWISGIFHCLYCHGWEQTGVSSSGILAEGDIAAVVPALHFARQALRISKQVTIYTYGNTQLAEDLEIALKSSTPMPPMKLDARKITRLEKGLDKSEVVLHFADGSQNSEGFLGHKPNSKMRGNLHNQLGLVLSPKGTIVVNPPFNQTSMKGVFAAGDISTPMQTITMAQAMGTLAGAGAPLQIQAEMWNQPAIF